MKNKILPLAVASFLFSSPAFAEPIDVKVGGYLKAYTNYTEQDDAGSDVNDFDILRRTEVHFDAKTKLDSGLMVGVHIEGIADPGADFTVDESLVYLSGEWGNINFGAKDGAAFLLQVAAPSADKDIDGVRQQIQPVNLTAFGLPVGETDYDQNISAKSDKITYITPLLSGFQAGVSYTPEVEDSRGGNGNSLDDDDTTASTDVIDAAVRYETKLSDVKIVTGAGFTNAKVETGPLDDRQAWNIGATLGFGGLSVGAAYMQDDEGSEDDDVTYTVVGVDYKLPSNDKISVGASYYNKDDQVGTEIETDRYIAGINYKYAPGIAFRSSVSHLTAEEDGGEEFEATSIVAGILVDF